MLNFNILIIKKGIILSGLFALTSLSVLAQKTSDTAKVVADTTSAGIKQDVIKGEKIRGTVTDGSTGKLISGINISVEGYSAAISDDKGGFVIPVPSNKSTIQISASGYHTKLIPAFKGKFVAVVIYPVSFPSLFSVANLPTGAQSVSRTVSALGSISNLDISNIKYETPDSYLQGRMAGINVVRRSGTPGVGADIFIRGFNSLSATNKPLYVVDGVIYDSESYGNSIISGHINNPLQFIDMRDVSDITVIKDAIGAAQYGTRSANGVVIINTNHATDLATRIDFSSYGGINWTPKSIPLLNKDGYRGYLSDILQSQGQTGSAVAALPYINDNLSTNPYYYQYHNSTDWQKQVFKQSYDQNYYLKVSGGDNIAKYFLSVGYLNDKGIIDTTSYQKYNTRFNADLNLTKKLSGNVNLAFTYATQNLKNQGISPTTNPLFVALIKAPFLSTNAVNTTGQVSPGLADVDVFGTSNPLTLLQKGNNATKAYRFSGSVNFKYILNPLFSLSTVTGITYNKNQESLFIPRLGVASDTLFNVIATSRLASQVLRYFSLFNDSRVTFSKSFNKVNRVNASLGVRYTTNNSETDFAQGYNSGTDQLKSVGNSDAATRTIGGSLDKWHSINSFLTADYSYADKYIVNTSVSFDGSSRFGPKSSTGLNIGGNSYAVLPAIGLAWIVSSEDFLKNAKNLDLLKLRLSYGLTGNDDIGNYTAQQYYVSQNLLGLEGLVRGNIANPNLQWEVVSKLNAGVDASFFKERLSMSVDVYGNHTSQMLTTSSITGLAGISTYTANNAAMTTTGLDVAMNGRVINTKLKWDLGVTLGHYNNQITSLGSGTFYNNYAGGTYITAVGQAANLFYGYRTNGVYATDAEAAADGLSVRATSGQLVPFKGGDVRFININSSDKVIDQNDMTVIGNPNPKLFGSINNRFNYKNWTFDALITFVTGNQLYDYTRAQLESENNTYNQTVAVLNRWRGQGQITNIPRATYGDPMGNSRFSDRWIEDGSYIRLRNISLTYNVAIKPTAIKYINVYATASNLVTFTKYLGYDPEFSSSGNIFNQGVDTTLEPEFKSFQIGIKLGL